MKVDILTMHAARNYGAVLQAYALQYVIENYFGYSAEIVNYVSTQRTNYRYFTKVIDRLKHSYLKSMLYLAAIFPSRLYAQIIFNKFVRKYLNLSKQKASNSEELKKLKLDADTFCAGSDQIWNPVHNDGIDSSFFLDFVQKDKRKISYASSVGTSELTQMQKSQMKELLSDFYAISYREYSTKKIFENLKINGEWVLDPTLLLNQSNWHSISANKKLPSDYLLLYWFGNPKSAMPEVKRIAKERNLKIVRISTILRKYKDDEIVEYYPPPERFIQLFENAKFVITDSFHGTAFSINFNKQFYSMPARKNDDRFYSLFEMFDIFDRDMLEEFKPLSNNDICYDKINKKLDEMRDISYSFLEKALKQE